MKTNQLNLIALLLLFVLGACSTSTKQESSEESSTEVANGESLSFTVATDASVVEWKGEVAGVYGHNGVISIAEGSLTTMDSLISSGKIVIDMTSIVPTDSASYSEENPAEKLVSHLSTGDFFLVDSFPTATFEVKSGMIDKLIGDLTIRGITNEETVELSSLDISEEGLTGVGTLVFDRKKYNVKWKHYIPDYVLSNDITLNISIVAK